MVAEPASLIVSNVSTPATATFDDARREVGRSDPESAEIDAVLVGRRAAVGVEAADYVGTEVRRVVDEGVEATADVDRVIATIADDRVVVVIDAADDDVVTETTIDHVVAVIAVEGVVTGTAEQLVVAVIAVDDVGEGVAGSIDRVVAGQVQVLDLVLQACS